jgi:diguanylate cyclase (GGDEF)-like protein
MQAEFNRSARSGSPVSVILMDVDHFKSVNDQYGHAVGDQALQLLAITLQHNRRDYDQVGRWGGEEFLVLLPNSDLAEAGAVAERMRASLAAAQLLLPGEQTLSIQVSLGVSCASTPRPDLLDALLQQADQALYRAKAAGRNQVCLFDPAVDLALPNPNKA